MPRSSRGTTLSEAPGQVWRHRRSGLRVRIVAAGPSRWSYGPGWTCEYPDGERSGTRWYHAGGFASEGLYDLEESDE